MPTFDLASLKEKQQVLEKTRHQLKAEFFGMDHIIDRAVDSLYAWYLFPELITRPVVVNLWGMTGVGKTQLVRRTASLLGMFDKFVEVQMDGFSNGSGYTQNSISSILRSSSIEEGQQGIVLLDEMQRFRTVGEHGEDLKVERFQDVWMLLSDGRMSASTSLFRDIEDMITYRLWDGDQSQDEDSPDALNGDEPKKRKKKPVVTTPRKYFLGPWEAQNLKQTLRLKEPVEEIMKWSNGRVMLALTEARTSRQSWELDYSKLLIFISGNLDEAFYSANRVEDCDTDADIYHELTSKITVNDIKQALQARFRPEQIARLGNNHVIYPSLSRDSYEKLIHQTCMRYITEMEVLSELRFQVDPAVFEVIYENAVYPTQGTRPVFSSAHKIFSSALSNLAVWGIETGLKVIDLKIDVENQVLIGSSCGISKSVPIDLDVNTARKRNTEDFNTLVAVHEAGHALVYTLLYQEAPQEVKINLASFSGGYMVRQTSSFELLSKQTIRNSIAVSLAGMAAEELVFGDTNRCNGCSRDIFNATELSSKYVRRFGMGDSCGLIAGEHGNETNWSTDLNGTNYLIETLLQEQLRRAKELLSLNQPALRSLVAALLQEKKLNEQQVAEILKPHIDLTEKKEVYRPLYTKWAAQTDKRRGSDDGL